MVVIDLPYRPKTRTFLFGFLVCGALAAFMGHEALGNHRGLIIDGVIELSPRGATIFYWALGALLAAVIVLLVPVYLGSISKGHRVILTDTTLSAPKFAASQAPTVIPLADVQGLWVQTISKQKLLTIRHRGGSLSIAMSFLPDEQAFDRLCGELERRVASIATAARMTRDG